jgi:hypothetical protein
MTNNGLAVTGVASFSTNMTVRGVVDISSSHGTNNIALTLNNTSTPLNGAVSSSIRLYRQDNPLYGAALWHMKDDAADYLNIGIGMNLNPYSNPLLTLKTAGLATLGGNVGIGTNNPQAKLHVAGTTLISSNVSINNGVTITGANDTNQLSIIANATQTDNDEFAIWSSGKSAKTLAFRGGNLSVTAAMTNKGMVVNGNLVVTNLSTSLVKICTPTNFIPSAVRGGIYFNSDSNSFYKCTNGTTWVAF